MMNVYPNKSFSVNLGKWHWETRIVIYSEGEKVKKQFEIKSVCRCEEEKDHLEKK